MPTLDFKGKSFAYAPHLSVPFRERVIDAKKSLPAKRQKPSLEDNLILHGDNLHALRAQTAERVRRVSHGYKFAGPQREELLREPLNWAKLQKAAALIENAESVELLDEHRFDRIAKTAEDSERVVTGEKNVIEETEGLGGRFNEAEPVWRCSEHKRAFRQLLGSRSPLPEEVLDDLDWPAAEREGRAVRAVGFFQPCKL